jgi:transposase
MAKYTFKQFQAEYPDDASCLAKLMEINYGGTTIRCPGCNETTAFHPMSKRRAYACQDCGHHVYPAAGTIFHKSRTNLTKWFFAMYLMTSTRHGVAAKEVERQLGVTYKCAWRMCHELRKLMAAADDKWTGGGDKMSGHVEIDETFVGGKRKHSEPDNKTIVFGMLQRDGRILAAPIPDVTIYTVEGIINENIEAGTTISTDEWHSYKGLRFAYDHGTVNHSKKEYVRGVHHVNGLESHWSLLKRAIKGTHVHISAKHSWKYVSEFSYGRNMRHSHWAMLNLLVQAFALPRLIDA